MRKKQYGIHLSFVVSILVNFNKKLYKWLQIKYIIINKKCEREIYEIYKKFYYYKLKSIFEVKHYLKRFFVQ